MYIHVCTMYMHSTTEHKQKEAYTKTQGQIIRQPQDPKVYKTASTSNSSILGYIGSFLHNSLSNNSLNDIQGSQEKRPIKVTAECLHAQL